jgi:hypothetical protein
LINNPIFIRLQNDDFQSSNTYARFGKKSENMTRKWRHPWQSIPLNKSTHNIMFLLIKCLSNDLWEIVKEFTNEKLDVFSVFKLEISDVFENLGQFFSVILGLLSDLQQVFL